MRNFAMNFFTAVGVLTVFGLMAACFSDSSAGGGTADTYTKAEVDAKLTDLRNELLSKIDGNSPNRLAASTSSGTAMGMQKAGAISDICTVLDYTPSASFPGRMSAASCKSPNGFLLTMPITTKAEPVRPALLDDAKIYFPTVDCTGDGYVHPDQIGPMGLTQGAVFGIMTNATFYTPPNPTVHENMQIASMLDPNTDPSGSRCAAVSTQLHGVEILSNDPAITGVQNTYDGPISMF